MACLSPTLTKHYPPPSPMFFPWLCADRRALVSTTDVTKTAPESERTVGAPTLKVFSVFSSSLLFYIIHSIIDVPLDQIITLFNLIKKYINSSKFAQKHKHEVHKHINQRRHL